MAACPLCDAQGESILWQDGFCRVILTEEADYPGFLRVILQAHVREMSDLDAIERAALMHVVWAAETALREVMQPDKINLASLGNVVPHLHWHVIPRFENDPHFPNPVWGHRLRDAPRPAPVTLADQLGAALNRLLARARGRE
ncbi:MAG: HIT family protein [Thiobacillus sp.]|nr:HIT family protein [Thiobacillus sp.]